MFYAFEIGECKLIQLHSALTLLTNSTSGLYLPVGLAPPPVTAAQSSP